MIGRHSGERDGSVCNINTSDKAGSRKGEGEEKEEQEQEQEQDRKELVKGDEVGVFACCDVRCCDGM